MAGSKTDEAFLIKQKFRISVTNRLSELGMSAADLAVATGNPRSTISQLLSDQNLRLPSVLSLVSIARALSLSLSDVLPAHLLSSSVNFHLERRAHFPDGIPSLAEVAALITRYNLRSNICYHPKTIPEFLKPAELLELEYGVARGELVSYMKDLAMFHQLRVSGVVLLDEGVLVSLIDRKGIFGGLSRHASLAAISAISEFSKLNEGAVSFCVCNRFRDKVDPILILSDEIALADYFGSLLLISDRALISTSRQRFKALSDSTVSFEAWLKTV